MPRKFQLVSKILEFHLRLDFQTLHLIYQLHIDLNSDIFQGVWILNFQICRSKFRTENEIKFWIRFNLDVSRLCVLTMSLDYMSCMCLDYVSWLISYHTLANWWQNIKAEEKYSVNNFTSYKTSNFSVSKTFSNFQELFVAIWWKNC
jgi:hypothetical protein